MSMRLKGSLGCTKMGVDSSSHWSMALKFTFTKPEMGAAGPGRLGAKTMISEVERSAMVS